MNAIAPDGPTRTMPMQATRREDRMLLAFASILIVGLFSDGWAHTNIVDELEGFITPWHAVVFIGYALTASWILLMIHRRRPQADSLRTAIPTGYEVAAAGVVVFAIGFNGDAIWHTVFGLESDIDALLSPTHLLMAIALVAIASTPFRTREPTVQPTWRTERLRIVSLMLTTMVIGFFLLYLWIPAFAIGSNGYAQWLDGFGAPPFMTEVSQIAVLASTFVITALILVPALVVNRSTPPPAGAALALILGPAVAVTAIREFSNPESLLAFLMAATAGEVITQRVTNPRRRAILLGAFLPAVLWTTYWITFIAVHGLAWEIELYTGQVVSTALAGVGIAALISTPASSWPRSTSTNPRARSGHHSSSTVGVDGG